MAKNTLCVGPVAVGLGYQVENSPRVDRGTMIETSDEGRRRWGGWTLRFFRTRCITIGRQLS